jgi:16S rRNA (guanine527-N7)-methyltransferase
LKIFFPNIKLTLLDSNNKKIEFLKKAVEILSLEDVELIYGRAEEESYKLENHFDIVVSRAVTDIRKGLEISSRFIKLSGYYLPLKSNKFKDELLDAESIIKKLNFELEKTEEYNTKYMYHYLPFFKKNNMTPKGYPRE